MALSQERHSILPFGARAENLSWSLQNWKLSSTHWHPHWEIMTHNDEFKSRKRRFPKSTFSPRTMVSALLLFQISGLKRHNVLQANEIVQNGDFLFFFPSLQTIVQNYWLVFFFSSSFVAMGGKKHSVASLWITCLL